MRRGLVILAVSALGVANTADGLGRIMAFRHSFTGSRALARAELDASLDSLQRAAWWSPDMASPYLTMGLVIQEALSNDIPLRELKGRRPDELLGFGLAATARAIALNPADAAGWSTVGTLHQAFRAARLREGWVRQLEAMGDEPETPENADDVKELEARMSELLIETRPDALDRVSVAAMLKAKRMEPSHYFYSDFIAGAYWKSGMMEDAARAIESSLALTPSLHAHPLMEDEAFVRDLSEPILRGIDRAAESPSAEPILVLTARAQVLEKLSRWDEAMHVYRTMRELPEKGLREQCDVEVGQLLQRQGLWSESLEPLRSASTGANERAAIRALYYLGIAQTNLGDLEAARASFERHIALHPDGEAAYSELGGVLDRMGRSGDAERVYTSAVRRFPRRPLHYENLIAHFRARGNARAAIPYALALRKVGSDPRRAERLVAELEAEAQKAGDPD